MNLFRTELSVGVAAAALFVAKGADAAEPQAPKSASTSSTQRAHLLWGIDHLSKCTFLERKSGIRRMSHYRDEQGEFYDVFVLMSADGNVEEYKFEFGADDRHPFAFRPSNHAAVNAAGPDTVRNSADSKLCLDVVSRLDKWRPRWPHYGKAMIQKDGTRGFRVSLDEEPNVKSWTFEQMISHMDPYINFSITRRGTVYAITYGP